MSILAGAGGADGGVRTGRALAQPAKSWVSQTVPLASRTASMPIIVNPLLRRLRRWPSFGGFSLYIAIVSPLAAARMAASVLAFGPDSPMFSPAECHLTPCAEIRGPRSASPGHRWDRPHVDGGIIVTLCRCALAIRPFDNLYGGSPFCARNWLT